MTGYVDITTDPRGPANSFCPPHVCCTITVPVPGSDNRAWIVDKVPVSGGHETFEIPDRWFTENRCLVSVILFWGATQWSFQDHVLNGGVLRITRYFGSAPGVVGECISGETRCDPAGSRWVCSPTTGIWLKTSEPCTPPTTPVPGPWQPPKETGPNLTTIGLGIGIIVVLVAAVFVLRGKKT